MSYYKNYPLDQCAYKGGGGGLVHIKILLGPIKSKIKPSKAVKKTLNPFLFLKYFSPILTNFHWWYNCPISQTVNICIYVMNRVYECQNKTHESIFFVRFITSYISDSNKEKFIPKEVLDIKLLVNPTR